MAVAAVLATCGADFARVAAEADNGLNALLPEVSKRKSKLQPEASGSPMQQTRRYGHVTNLLR